MQTHLQILKYFFIAGLPKYIMQKAANKDPETFTEAHIAARKCHDLAISNQTNGHGAAHTVAPEDNSVNQIRGNGSQNPYRSNYRGHGLCGNRGAP